MPWQCELEIGEPDDRLVSRMAREFETTGRIRSTKYSYNLLKGVIEKDVSVKPLIDFIHTQYAHDISTLDGKVVIWFYPHVPTIANEPYTFWADDEERDKHLNDLLFDTTPGYAYRFTKDGQTYS